MKRSILKMERDISTGKENRYRSIFKTRHGRVVFLAIESQGDNIVVAECFYPDRNQGRDGESRYESKPKKLKTLRFHKDNLLSVIESELDKKFFGLEFVQSNQENLSLNTYLDKWQESISRKYKFLIMVKDGDEEYCGIPIRIRTRLKNKIHRSIFIDLMYYRDGKGVVARCTYYDRKYENLDRKVVPPMLTSCFFPYTKQGIINLINHELFCEFTHMVIVDDENIDLDSNPTPLCGSI